MDLKISAMTGYHWAYISTLEHSSFCIGRNRWVRGLMFSIDDENNSWNVFNDLVTCEDLQIFSYSQPQACGKHSAGINLHFLVCRFRLYIVHVVHIIIKHINPRSPLACLRLHALRQVCIPCSIHFPHPPTSHAAVSEQYSLSVDNSPVPDRLPHSSSLHFRPPPDPLLHAPPSAFPLAPYLGPHYRLSALYMSSTPHLRFGP